MMKVSLIAAIGLSFASSASAEFLGFDGTLSTNGNGDNVVQMFAVFDDANTIGLNVFNADIGASSDFLHSDVQVAAGGTWNPTASLDIPGFADSANDSYVTMGYGVGAAAALNGTALDPGFAPTGGVDGISGYGIMIGQFVWSGAAEFAFIADIGANTGAGSDVVFGNDSFVIPAPGALALLGLGGLAARRRRG